MRKWGNEGMRKCRWRDIVFVLLVGMPGRAVADPVISPFPHSPISPFPHSLISSFQHFAVDGLAAVVAGDPIFLSDVRDAEQWRLFEPEGALAAVADRDGAEAPALSRLIDRRLVLGEIARYAPLRPLQSEVDAAMARWRARTSDLRLDAAVVDPIALAFIVDSLRIERYIEQRFTAAAQPTREEARAWYLANRERFTESGVTRDFDDVEDEARARLAEERRLAMVRTWLADLRSRAQVRVVRSR